MVLLSGEVETAARVSPVQAGDGWKFRMVLLSGEVETAAGNDQMIQAIHSSGWFCYPGKLKHSWQIPGIFVSNEVPDGFAIRGS